MLKMNPIQKMDRHACDDYSYISPITVPGDVMQNDSHRNHVERSGELEHCFRHPHTLPICNISNKVHTVSDIHTLPICKILIHVYTVSGIHIHSSPVRYEQCGHCIKQLKTLPTSNMFNHAHAHCIRHSHTLTVCNKFNDVHIVSGIHIRSLSVRFFRYTAPGIRKYSLYVIYSLWTLHQTSKNTPCM